MYELEEPIEWHRVQVHCIWVFPHGSNPYCITHDRFIYHELYKFKCLNNPNPRCDSIRRLFVDAKEYNDPFYAAQSYRILNARLLNGY